MEKINYYFKDIQKSFVSNYFDLLTKIIMSHRYTESEMNQISKAYNTARDLHSGTFRQSGEPFIIHPLNVANVLVEYGFDCNTICAALLHDTVEDTPYTLEELKEDFNNDIAMLVDGVTKMKKADFSNKEENRIATHKKILQSITKDARIIAIKLADRLHNMMTLEAMDKSKQMEIAEETNCFYVPIARNLGIYKMKDEIQDLSLFYIDNDSFLKHYELRNKIKKDHQQQYAYLGKRTKDILMENDIILDYNYKVKNVAGIKEELSRGKRLEQIHDLVAIRMLLNEKIECYQTLGAVHEVAKPVIGSVVDYIAVPKYNGYKSLNTNVLVDGNLEFQVRIRTTDMQKINSLGVISNWNQENQKLINQMCLSLVELNDIDIPDSTYMKVSEASFLKRTIRVNTLNGFVELKEQSSGYDFLNATCRDYTEDDILIINEEEKPFDSILEDGDFVSVVKKEKNSILEKKKRGI